MCIHNYVAWVCGGTIVWIVALSFIYLLDWRGLQLANVISEVVFGVYLQLCGAGVCWDYCMNYCLPELSSICVNIKLCNRRLGDTGPAWQRHEGPWLRLSLKWIDNDIFLAAHHPLFRCLSCVTNVNSVRYQHHNSSQVIDYNLTNILLDTVILCSDWSALLDTISQPSSSSCIHLNFELEK